MSYTIHHTNALILSSGQYGEADAIVTLFTEDFGRVHARAIGVRKEASKLRFALQPYSYAKVALVRGREVWRLTGAQIQHSLFYDCPADMQPTLLRVTSLLKRLVHGEEAHPELFVFLSESLHPQTLSSLTKEDRELLEIYIVFRVVTMLGYGSEDLIQFEQGSLADYCGQELTDRLERLRGHQKQLVRHINQALEASHL